MKSILIFLLLLLVSAGLLFSLLLLKVLPKKLRPGILGFSALMLSFTAQNASGAEVICYMQPNPNLAPGVNDKTEVKDTAEWKQFKYVYSIVVDYIAKNQFDEKAYKLLAESMQEVELYLDTLVQKKMMTKPVADCLKTGINQQMASYDGVKNGVSCYIPVMTPEFERSMTLSNVVGRQVEIKKLQLKGDLLNSATVEQIEFSMFGGVEKYLSSSELELYKNLIKDIAGL
jgi:hypothetical protein